MLVAGGGLCIAVSRAALTAADADAGDEVEVVVHRAGPSHRDAESTDCR